MKDQQRPPLDHHDNCTFAVSVDWDAAQITLEGPPAGPAGRASLTPVPGVELVFDRAGGRLSQVVVEAGEPFGPVVPGEPALAYLGRLLGAPVAAVLRQAQYGTVPPVTPRPHPAVIAAVSRLAGLEAARRTTPVPCSPLWTMEAAGLARQCRRAFTLASAWPALPAAPTAPPRLPPGPVSPGFNGWLDPDLVPAGVFRYGLTPDSDLDIRAHGPGEPLITVEVGLARGVGWPALASCRVRLVDSGTRRILATSPLRPHGMRARAELPAPGDPHTLSLPTQAGAVTSLPTQAGAATLWVEVVDDERRPVRGTRLRRMRQALRWADAALRAASRPAGLDPGRTDEEWAGLAALAWDRCSAGWAAAGDAERADVAARLARYPLRWTRPYRAEATCDPATAR